MMPARRYAPLLSLQAAIWMLLSAACPAEPRDGTASEQAAETQSLSPVPDAAGAEQSINSYQERIAKLQSQYGASDPRLAESLLGLGLAYRAAGQHEEAADAFKQALYIVRMNDGLENLDQLPYLNRLIEENTTLGRWKRLNRNYYYLYWVCKRNYGDNDPRLLPVIERITRAQLDIYNASPKLFTGSSLRQREALVNKAVVITESHYGQKDPRLIEALNRLALNDYYMALHTGKMWEYRSYKTYMRRVTSEDLFTRTFVPVVRTVAGHVMVRYVPIDVPKMNSRANLSREEADIFRQIDNTERKGRQALERIRAIVESNPNSTPYARAVALARLGDWQVLYENGRGWRKYEQAYALLSRSEQGARYIPVLFGRPRTLPALNPAPDSKRPPQQATDASPDGSMLKAVFDVTGSGRARRIRISDPPPGVSGSTVRGLKLYLSALRFRPRLQDGKPVMTRDVNFHYIVNEKGRIVARER
jgi:tetratricopeptide (TPR) repeat protein